MTSLRTIKKRRKENKTDYNLRFNLLKSKTPRIVIRRTNKYFIIQAVESEEAKDKVLKAVCSRDLKEHGWSKNAGSLKSVPAGYLAGLLMANELGNKGKYIIDLGMARNVHGSRNFAVIKGLIDGGLDINADEEAFPSEDRVNGKHLKPEVQALIKKVKETLE